MGSDNIKGSRALVRNLKFCRLWPNRSSVTSSSTSASRIRLLELMKSFTLHFFVTFTFTAMMWIEAVSSEDFEHCTDVLFITLTMTSLVAKIFNNWHYAKIARNLLEEWSDSPQFEVHSGPERDMWEREQLRFLRFALLYCFCSLGVVPCIFISAAYNYPNELPFLVWVPFDWQKPAKFWCLYAYQLFAVPFTCLSNITSDLLNCYLMLYISLCFKMLGMRLSVLAPTGHRDSERQLRVQLLDLIRLHRRVKAQAEMIQIFISKSTLIQILLSAIILCLSIYRMQMLNVFQTPSIFLAMLEYLFAMTMQIYLPSIYGNDITRNADRLPTALYSCSWPDMSKPMRRLILCFMIYLNRPLVLRAGGFFEVGLPLFTKTMNQAYSLLALLLNVNSK
ncbi:putative odorant receptor 71a isoform X1 [Drosophila navojoa]|uniref:putative odorant receptor 71a isoform X1 n=1 Tax=Drosophila navojoa TaxID=7232 RepID=UPI00084673A8|nr:putative odorant receptor 71a isoform X1 [Drosophila navojoa]